MENIFEKIDKMIHTEDERPAWADEILHELKEIKTLLQQHKQPKRRDDKAYFKFVDMLRDRMRADIAKGNYPEIYYQGRTLGINFKGHIYNKADTLTLPSREAFKIYRFLYENRDKLENYVSF